MNNLLKVALLAVLCLNITVKCVKINICCQKDLKNKKGKERYGKDGQSLKGSAYRTANV